MALPSPNQTPEQAAKAAYARSWRAKNIVRLREYGRAQSAKWREMNLEQFQEYQRTYHRHPSKRRRQWERELQKTYGITIDDYNRMLDEQEHSCAICGVEAWDAGGKGNRLHVDHDHTSGRVRALLCNKCNVGLGSFRDDPAALRAAADYLEKHAENI